MKVKFKKLLPGAVLPKKATEGSAAYDLYVPKDLIVERGRQVIPLCFAMEMEDGYEALIDARSGFSARGMEGYRVITSYRFDNHFGSLTIPRHKTWPECEEVKIERSVNIEAERFDCDVIQGKIDSDYRNDVGVIVHNRGCEFLLRAGTRIAQMTFHKVETVEWEETDTLSETGRLGGFGHTGTKEINHGDH